MLPTTHAGRCLLGLAWSGAATAARISLLLDRLPPGVVEIYAHPASADAFAGHAPGYRYTRGGRVVLTDLDSGIVALRRSGYRLGGLGDV